VESLLERCLGTWKTEEKAYEKDPKKWTNARYFQTFIHYEVLKAEYGREKALRWIGKSEGIGKSKEQVFDPKKVLNIITKARKVVKENKLERYLPPFVKPIK